MLAPDRRRNGWILWLALVAFLIVLAVVILAAAQ